MSNSNQVKSPAPKVHYYPFKSVHTYNKQLSQNEIHDEVLDPSDDRVNQNRSGDTPEKDASDPRTSRFTFETQTKCASRSFGRDSLHQGVIAIQGESGNNFLKPEERNEIRKLLTDERSSVNLPDISSHESKDLLALSKSNQYRHSISHTSLAQVQEKDPFAFKKATDHWNFKSREVSNSKISNAAGREKAFGSNSVFGCATDRSEQGNFKLRATPIGMNKFLLKKLRSSSTIEELSNFSMNKNLSERKHRHLPPLHDKGSHTMNMIDLSPKINEAAGEKELSYINPENDLLEILAQAKGSEVVDLEDMPLSKRTHQLQEANNEVNYILHSGRYHEALNALDSNVPVNDTNVFERLKEVKRSASHGILRSKSMKAIEKKDTEQKREQEFMSQKAVGTTDKKKNHYNKWYVPVEYWNVIKEPSFKDKKSEELKKNILFIYNNIHNYNKKDFNPLSGKPFKGVQQIRYEAAQESLKQNPMIHRMKKNLTESNSRIPKILNNIIPEKVSYL